MTRHARWMIVFGAALGIAGCGPMEPASEQQSAEPPAAEAPDERPVQAQGPNSFRACVADKLGVSVGQLGPCASEAIDSTVEFVQTTADLGAATANLVGLLTLCGVDAVKLVAVTICIPEIIEPGN